jgi:hypothetical protein
VYFFVAPGEVEPAADRDLWQRGPSLEAQQLRVFDLRLDVDCSNLLFRQLGLYIS